MSSYSLLFSTFFRIGVFTLGGGYAMLPIIERDVVDKYHWIKKEEFIDIVAVAQSCPGVFAINMATFVGYKLKGTKGALCTTLGSALPSFLIILTIAMFLHHIMEWHWVEAMFRGIRPAVVALIAAPTFTPISACPTVGYLLPRRCSSGGCTSTPSGSSSPRDWADMPMVSILSTNNL